MSSYSCPIDGHVGEPAAQVGAVIICAGCGASLAVGSDGQARRATAADTTALTEAERQTLRKARGRTR